jgi:hypothetical protein
VTDGRGGAAGLVRHDASYAGRVGFKVLGSCSASRRCCPHHCWRTRSTVHSSRSQSSRSGYTTAPRHRCRRSWHSPRRIRRHGALAHRKLEVIGVGDVARRVDLDGVEILGGEIEAVQPGHGPLARRRGQPLELRARPPRRWLLHSERRIGPEHPRWRRAGLPPLLDALLTRGQTPRKRHHQRQRPAQAHPTTRHLLSPVLPAVQPAASRNTVPQSADRICARLGPALRTDWEGYVSLGSGRGLAFR